jgi:hypothetical protein
MEIHIKKFKLGCNVLEQTKKNILEDLLPRVQRREVLKYTLDKIHNYEFDLLYEARCKELGVKCKVDIVRKSKEDLITKYEPLEIVIPIDRPQLQLTEAKEPVLSPRDKHKNIKPMPANS